MKTHNMTSLKSTKYQYLPAVPSHWEVKKPTHIYTGIGSGTTPKTDKPIYYNGGTIPWLNTGDLNNGELFDCASRITQEALNEVSSLKIYPKGSVAIAMYGATIGKASLLEFETTVNQACCVFPPCEKVVPKFMLYTLLSYKDHFLSQAAGGGQLNINQEILKSTRIPVPPLEEQNQIVEFLDKETQKLDALIEKQEKLISLLQERKKTLIQLAIAGQIDSNSKFEEG